jgi:hypothetical protein
VPLVDLNSFLVSGMKMLLRSEVSKVPISGKSFSTTLASSSNSPQPNIPRLMDSSNKLFKP